MGNKPGKQTSNGVTYMYELIIEFLLSGLYFKIPVQILQSNSLSAI